MSIPSTLPPALRTATPQNGSVTITETPAQPPVVRLSVPSGTLRLRAQPAERRHIQWAEDVVDNEGMGKKSSKVCCIYHKPREVGESSDESSSDSSSSDESDSDSEPDNSTARPAAGTGRGRARGHRQQQQPPHNHNHDDHDCDHQHDDTSNGDAPRKQHRQRRRPSPNAYEKMPKNQK